MEFTMRVLLRTTNPLAKVNGSSRMEMYSMVTMNKRRKEKMRKNNKKKSLKKVKPQSQSSLYYGIQIPTLQSLHI
jgi:hypothetical protein